MTRSKRIYVLDTNVLMHDPTALFKFEEHDVYLPMTVLEELDNGKKGHLGSQPQCAPGQPLHQRTDRSHGKPTRSNDGLKLVRPQGLQLAGGQIGGCCSRPRRSMPASSAR
jgi:PhoH-like ATPase